MAPSLTRPEACRRPGLAPRTGQPTGIPNHALPRKRGGGVTAAMAGPSEADIGVRYTRPDSPETRRRSRGRGIGRLSGDVGKGVVRCSSSSTMSRKSCAPLSVRSSRRSARSTSQCAPSSRPARRLEKLWGSDGRPRLARPGRPHGVRWYRADHSGNGCRGGGARPGGRPRPLVGHRDPVRPRCP